MNLETHLLNIQSLCTRASELVDEDKYAEAQIVLGIAKQHTDQVLERIEKLESLKSKLTSQANTQTKGKT